MTEPQENFFFKRPSMYLDVCARVSVQGVKSLGGHFACLCRGFEFYEVKKKNFVIIFQKENGNTFTILINFYSENASKRAK